MNSTNAGSGRTHLSAIALLAVTVLGLLAACSQPSSQAAPLAGAAGKPAAQDVPEEGRIFCYVETLTSDRPSSTGYIAAQGCVPTGEFKRGERSVWRFIVMDLTTGKPVTPKEATRVVLRLPYGYDVEAEYKQRGEGRVPDAPWTWDVCWDVPMDYPLGVLDYSILVSMKDGRTSSWKPPALVDPSRGIDTRPRIVGSVA